MHSKKVPIDRKDPDSPTETVFVGTLEEARQAVLAEAREERTGDIPDYPQGTVICNCFGKNQISIPISEA